MSPIGGRKGFGINTYSFIQAGPVESAIDALGNISRTFELVMYPGHLWPAERDNADRARLRRRMADRGCRALTLNMPNIDINVAAAAPEMRQHSLRLLEDFIRLAGDLGAGAIVLGPGKSNPLFPERPDVLEAHFAAALDRLLPSGRNAGVELWVENMPFAFLPLTADVLGVLDRYGARDVGLVYDVANAHFAGEDPVAGLQLAAASGRLKLLHLSDTGRMAYRHSAVGSGSVPFARVASALSEIGQNIDVVVEIIATDDAVTGIADSISRLTALGFGSTMSAG